MYALNLTLFNGSSVAIEGGSQAFEAPLSVVALGSGNVSIERLEVPYLNLQTFGSSVSITEVVSEVSRLDLVFSSLAMTTSEVGFLEYMAIWSSNVTLDDCSLELNETRSRVNVDEASLAFNGCDVAYTGPPDVLSNVSVHLWGNSSLHIQGSRFLGTVIRVDGLNDWMAGVGVVDNTFEDSVLWIEPQRTTYGQRMTDEHLNGTGVRALEGNAFSGGGLVVSGVFRTPNYALNTFEDGARMFVRYRPAFNYSGTDGVTHIFVEGGQGRTSEVMGGRVTGDMREVFVDVTDDPSRIGNPGEVTVMLLSTTEWDDLDELLDFQRVDPSQGEVIVEVRDWGSFGYLLEEFLEMRPR